MTILGGCRDLVKAGYLFAIQLYNRLFILKRKKGSSVSCLARLDLLQRGVQNEINSLILKKRASIEARCVVNTWHGEVYLDEGSALGIGTIVIGPLRLGKRSELSQNCFASGESHKYMDVSIAWQEQGFHVAPVIVEDHVWVGSNSVILPGVTIGAHSVVGAGSVVTKDIPAYSLAVGNPARVIKQFDQDSGQWRRIPECDSE